MTYNRAWLDTKVAACVEAWRNRENAYYSKGYLYYRPSTESEEGILVILPDEEAAPEGFKLALGEGFRRQTWEQMKAMIRAVAGQLPICIPY